MGNEKLDREHLDAGKLQSQSEQAIELALDSAASVQTPIIQYPIPPQATNS